jgi:hypothetical protein
MQPSTARRWLLLAGALALSLAATGWLGAEENSSAEAEATATHVAHPPGPADDRSRGADAEIRVAAMGRRAAAVPAKELFDARTWQSQPAPSARQDPPPPSAPTLPFVYLGKMIYDGTTTVFLGSQDRTYTVKEGDVMDGSYRVDSIKGPLLTLTYLPLETQQTLHIGDQN